MRAFLGLLCAFLLVFQVPASAANQQQVAATSKLFVLEDATPVRLRIAQTVSSADAHVNDKVEFEVLEEVKVSDIVVIPKGGVAWGTITEAVPKRRMGRAGKLEIVLDSVRLVDGQKAALRAVKEGKGGSHVGGMTIGIVAAAVVFWPAAPLFLLMHGKDITFAKGTDVPSFINGDMKLDPAKFQQDATGSAVATGGPESVTISSTPAGAEIYLDQNFVGNAPSTLTVPAGKHNIAVKKNGFQDWVHDMNFTGGTVNLIAELVPVAAGSPAPAESPAVATPTPSVNVDAQLARFGILEVIEAGTGVKIKAITPDGPAAKVHLLSGDVITAINGAATSSPTALATELAKCASGSEVQVDYTRSMFGADTPQKVSAVLGN